MKIIDRVLRSLGLYRISRIEFIMNRLRVDSSNYEEQIKMAYEVATEQLKREFKNKDNLDYWG